MNQETRCPTCESTDVRVRGKFPRFLSYFQKATDLEDCADPWHFTPQPPAPEPATISVGQSIYTMPGGSPSNPVILAAAPEQPVSAAPQTELDALPWGYSENDNRKVFGGKGLRVVAYRDVATIIASLEDKNRGLADSYRPAECGHAKIYEFFEKNGDAHCYPCEIAALKEENERAIEFAVADLLEGETKTHIAHHAQRIIKEWRSRIAELESKRGSAE